MPAHGVLDFPLKVLHNSFSLDKLSQVSVGLISSHVNQLQEKLQPLRELGLYLSIQVIVGDLTKSPAP